MAKKKKYKVSVTYDKTTTYEIQYDVEAESEAEAKREALRLAQGARDRDWDEANYETGSHSAEVI